MRPLLTVVVPVYNGGDDIVENVEVIRAAAAGATGDEEVEVIVHDSTADIRYMVLPMRPPGTEGMSEEELTQLVTRDCLIGVAVPREPARMG